MNTRRLAITSCLLFAALAPPASGGGAPKITEVSVRHLSDRTIAVVKGRNFPTGALLEIRLGDFGDLVLDGSSTDRRIRAELPAGMLPGDYRLVVRRNDGVGGAAEHDLTVGAPGPPGKRGPRGAEGGQGALGPPGDDGDDGAPGEDGRHGLWGDRKGLREVANGDYYYFDLVIDVGYSFDVKAVCGDGLGGTDRLILGGHCSIDTYQGEFSALVPEDDDGHGPMSADNIDFRDYINCRFTCEAIPCEGWLTAVAVCWAP